MLLHLVDVHAAARAYTSIYGMRIFLCHLFIYMKNDIG